MPDSGPEEIVLEITDDGAAATWWWTEEADQILSTLGPPAPGFEEVNQIPGVGNSPISKTLFFPPDRGGNSPVWDEGRDGPKQKAGLFRPLSFSGGKTMSAKKSDQRF